jgi:hypothetical protein
MDGPHPSTRQKALALNLDPAPYGTIAEIGGGQEVARWFFHVGGAAGTIAKTISAYDMAVSDGLYGPTRRYVGRERLTAMLEREYTQLVSRLGPARGDRTAFFAFADTVATGSYRRPGPGRGWLGIRFQARPGEAPSDVVLHAHLLDPSAAQQQEALGTLGVNLIHAAWFHHGDVAAVIARLLDDVSRARVEIDMLRFSGPAFAAVDNRLVSLWLVEQQLTDAAMFTAAGDVVQPSEVLYGRPVLVERGTFRPVTRLTLDVLERSRDLFLQEPAVAGQTPIVLAEMTLHDLALDRGVDHADFLARADLLGHLGFDVVISRFELYYQLADFLSAFTDRLIGIAVGVPGLRELARSKYYEVLPGGLLEAMGRLFKRSVRMYVYPTRLPGEDQLVTAETAPVAPPWHHFRDLLLETGHLVPIREYDAAILETSTADVLARLQAGDPGWEALVPPVVADAIKTGQLFGWRPAAAPGTR